MTMTEPLFEMTDFLMLLCGLAVAAGLLAVRYYRSRNYWRRRAQFFETEAYTNMRRLSEKRTDLRRLVERFMTTRKTDYVLRQRAHPQGHHCHWPGCTQEVPPALWGCKRHWFALPLHLRNEIWRTYRPGQEITKTPSADYIKAAQAVQEWIATHKPGTFASHA